MTKQLQNPNHLPSIFHCGMLSAESTLALESLKSELHNTWNKRQVFRTETEMRIGVLNEGAFPTRPSKYWQCVREQAMMLDNLAIIGFDYRKNEVALKRNQLKLLDAESDLDKEEIQIDIDECLFKQASLRQNAEDRVREIKLWSQLKDELDDASFDTQDVNKHQLDSLLAQLRERQRTLTNASTQAEVLSVLGQLYTAEQIKANNGN